MSTEIDGICEGTIQATSDPLGRTICGGAVLMQASKPDLTIENAKLRADNKALLEALKACHLQMLQSNNQSEYAEEANQLAIAALEQAGQKERG